MLRLRPSACLVLGLLLVPAAAAAKTDTLEVRRLQALSRLGDSLDVLVSDYAGSLDTTATYRRNLASFEQAIGTLHAATRSLARPGFVDAIKLHPVKPVNVDPEQAISTIKLFVGTYFRDSLTSGSPRFRSLLDPHFEMLNAEAAIALRACERNLANYDRRFGTNGVPMNAVEAGLYLLVFQRIPGFGPDPLHGPGVLEPVAAYVPVYATISEGSAAATSVLEVGLRCYLYGPSWGKPGLGGLTRPAYLSFGFATASQTDGALQSPLRGVERLGGFFAWGDLKLAVLGGKHPRVLVSRQFQTVRGLL